MARTSFFQDGDTGSIPVGAADMVTIKESQDESKTSQLFEPEEDCAWDEIARRRDKREARFVGHARAWGTYGEIPGGAIKTAA